MPSRPGKRCGFKASTIPWPKPNCPRLELPQPQTVPSSKTAKEATPEAAALVTCSAKTKPSMCLVLQLMCAYKISMMHLKLGKSINSGWGCSRLQWLQRLSQLSFIVAPVRREQSHSLTQSQSGSCAMFKQEYKPALPPSKQLALQIDCQAVVVTSSDFCYVHGKVNFFGIVIVPKAAAAQCTLDTASASTLTSAQVESFVHAQQEQRLHL